MPHERIDDPSRPPCECEVVIVGAGVAGASAAYHLAVETGVRDVIILDSGSRPGEGVAPRRSGSAVMDSAPTVKMMVRLFATSCDGFVAHHGRDGAQRYLRLAAEGMKLQKAIARRVMERPDERLREMGSYYVAYERDEGELRREFDLLRSLGCDDVEWCDRERLSGVAGCSRDFHCAIYFPDDAVIDSSSYAKDLLRAAGETGSARFFGDTRVRQITDADHGGDDGGALVELESGARIRCRHVVVATGGLFQVPRLCGLLKPCYSYLVHVPVSGGEDQQCEHSSNFFTWGFTHDWCWTGGKIRCSGEDHFSAYKPPLLEERCANLTRWTREKYGEYDPAQVGLEDVPHQYGVYSETPDHAPLIGHLNTGSNVCYLLGCNAWGQTVLSYSSSLVPGLLGYKPLTELQRDSLRLLSIRRFSILKNL